MSGSLGEWGGECTCPDGSVFFAADRSGNCRGGLACFNGGHGGNCYRSKGPWSFKKVTCKGCPNLAHADLELALLSYADFSGVDLSRTRLVGADLHDANFKDAQCVGTSFFEANLENAVFDGADLTDANLASANLKGASFRGSKLTRTRFTYANLEETYFSDVPKSEGAVFDDAHAMGLYMIRSELPMSTWRDTWLNDAEFEFVGLQRAKFQPKFEEARPVSFKQSTLDHAVMTQASLSGIILEKCSLQHASMRDALLHDSVLLGSRFEQAYCRGVDFSRSNAKDCDFTGANLEKARFLNADVTGAVFAEASFDQTDFHQAVGVDSARFRASHGSSTGLPSSALQQRPPIG